MAGAAGRCCDTRNPGAASKGGLASASAGGVAGVDKECSSGQ
jgi:hypothetical protein